MNHHRLRCYRLLLEVAKRMPTIVRALPRGSYHLADQLKRALESALLNLSEGNGRTSQRERGRFFDISLASIAETSTAIDIISAYGYISANMEMEVKTMLKRSYGMIRNLKKSNITS